MRTYLCQPSQDFLPLFIALFSLYALVSWFIDVLFACLLPFAFLINYYLSQNGEFPMLGSLAPFMVSLPLVRTVLFTVITAAIDIMFLLRISVKPIPNRLLPSGLCFCHRAMYWSLGEAFIILHPFCWIVSVVLLSSSFSTFHLLLCYFLT